MKNLLIGLAALPFLAGAAMASQPMSLNDAQMDKVTAGQASNNETLTVLDVVSFYPPSEAIFFVAPEPGGNSRAPLNIQAIVNGNVFVNVGFGTPGG